MKVLVISPFFVPVNTPDMHRVRQLVPYFKSFQCEVVVYCVDEQFVSFNKEEALSKTIPNDIEIVKIKPSNNRLFKWLGVNNVALKSIYNIYKSVSKRLKSEKIDLIFFSTTSFPVTVLGRIWKSQFSIPYVIDMQDPWRSDHYLKLPKSQRPSKFYFSYVFDSILEWYTINGLSGILSVNKKYIDTLKSRYKKIKSIPELIMPFGYSEIDFKISNEIKSNKIIFNPEKINVVYIGRVNNGMLPACELLFKSIQYGLKQDHELFQKIKLYFIGTSYSTVADESSHVDKIALKYLSSDMIEVYPERIGYLEAMSTLNNADIAFMPGSIDGDYIASKVLNILYSNIKVFAISNSNSEIVELLRKSNEVEQIFLDSALNTQYYDEAVSKLQRLIKREVTTIKNDTISQYSAQNQALQLIQLFNTVNDNKV